MVNVFSRLTRRATSSGSATADASIKQPLTHGSTQNRTPSASSAKRRRAPADEPARRRLLLISDTADFDPHITHRFQAEGFDVTFLGFVCSGDSERDRKALENAVHEKEDELEEGERYAIVGMSPFPTIFSLSGCIEVLMEKKSIQPPSILPPRLAPPNKQQHESIPASLCADRVLPAHFHGPMDSRLPRWW